MVWGRNVQLDVHCADVRLRLVFRSVLVVYGVLGFSWGGEEGLFGCLIQFMAHANRRCLYCPLLLSLLIFMFCPVRKLFCVKRLLG